MKLILNGKVVGLKIDKDGDVFLALEPSKDTLDLQEVIAFVKHECEIRILSNKQDFRVDGYIEELNLKNKLKLKVVCLGKVDLNALNTIIDDPETTSIIFDDKQTALTDFAEEMVSEFGVKGSKELVKAAKEVVTSKG